MICSGKLSVLECQRLPTPLTQHLPSLPRPLARQVALQEVCPLRSSMRHVAKRGRRIVVQAAIKKGKEKTVVSTKTLVCKPGNEKKVMQMCQDIMAFSKGRMNNKAAGILEFECNQDQFEPHVFHMWERYDCNANLGRHNTTPEYHAFLERLQKEELLEGPVGMCMYEWRDGQLGQTAMQAGPKGEGGLDDATGASGMAGGSGYKQTSPVVNLGKIRRGDEGDSFGMGFIFPWLKKKLTGK